MRCRFCAACVIVLTLGLASSSRAEDSEAISPTETIKLFNGKNLDGLYTWLSDAKYEDPRKVFTVEDGLLRISGNGFGYVATKQRYKDYHLVAEYRWGEKTWQSRKTNARDSGLILHCVEPDGALGKVFMAGIEAQVIEGGTGDILVVGGSRADGSPIHVSAVAETVQGPNNATIWKKGAPRKTLAVTGQDVKRIDWWGRDPGWKDTIGFRGKQDVESPGQEWTRLDVVCDGGHITYTVNGKLANEAFEVNPSSGKLLFQAEGAEVFVRRWELQPLNQK